MTVAFIGTSRHRRRALAAASLLLAVVPAASGLSKRASPTHASSRLPVAASRPRPIRTVSLPATSAMSARLAKLSQRAALHAAKPTVATLRAVPPPQHRAPQLVPPLLAAAVRQSAPIVRVAPAEPAADPATASRVHAWLEANDPMRVRADAATGTASNTAADDAAAQTSHIPSTAPTERVPSPVRTADIAPTTAPLVLSKPPAAAPAVTNAMLTKPAPAAAALIKSAKKPKLDPDTAEAMTAQTFANTDTELPPLKKPSTIPELLDAPAPPLSASPDLLVDTSGRMVILPPMKGSHEILVHQNEMAAGDGLQRIATDAELAQMTRGRQLAQLPDTAAIQPNDRLPYNRRYARPWTVRFLEDMGRAHYARFGTALIVTSAVRTVSFQRRLMRINGNAAPPSGDTASPHLYGQAVDIGKSGMSMAEIAWLRAFLTPVEAAGKIDVEEEFQQACFHISVYRRYTGAPMPRTEPVRELPVQQIAKAAPASKRHRIPTAMLATVFARRSR